MRIAIPLFDGFAALDVAGPYEVLANLPGAEIGFVAARPGTKRSDNGSLEMVAGARLSDLADPDAIVVPGGFGTRALLDEAELLGWIRDAHAGTGWTTSVCTGSLLLAAAGVLDGVEATTHWLEMDRLAELGARPVEERVVERGKTITSAGVSAGIDMALILAARIAGEDVARAIQLGIEYDPRPPFDSGSPSTAPAELAARVRAEAERSLSEGRAVS